MPHHEDHVQDLSAALMRRAEAGADASQIATSVSSAMGAIEAVLRPVIGRGGVAAMYRRALLTVAASHVWLRDGDGSRNGIDLDTLRSSLAERAAADAVTAGDALLRTFVGLLASLVGASLSERLLRNVRTER